MSPLSTVELTWLNGSTWTSVWRCSPDGERRRWEGFKRLDAALLCSPALCAVTTVVAGAPGLRRALATIVTPIAGSDGADVVTCSIQEAS